MIPIEDIEGVAHSITHLQLRYDGKLYVVRPYRWFSDTVDVSQSDALYELLTFDAVPEIASTNVFGFRGAIYGLPPANVRELSSDPANFDLYYWEKLNSRLYNEKPEYPEPLYPVQLDSSLNGTPPPYPPGKYPTTGQ